MIHAGAAMLLGLKESHWIEHIAVTALGVFILGKSYTWIWRHRNLQHCIIVLGRFFYAFAIHTKLTQLSSRVVSDFEISDFNN